VSIKGDERDKRIRKGGKEGKRGQIKGIGKWNERE
jgi:hypothetical protein